MRDIDNADLAMAICGILGLGLLATCTLSASVTFQQVTGPFSTLIGIIGGMGSKDLLGKLKKEAK